MTRSRGTAAELIRSGSVRVDGAVVTKPATTVAPQTAVDAGSVAGAGHEFVSRGAAKLAGALHAFDEVDVAGRRCLDAGASTGGFTEVLLAHGARRVYAVDVGHDQLHPQVAAHPRVVRMDRTHIDSLAAADIDGPADLTVADLSFISLRQVIGRLAELTAADGWVIPMVKPQFEAGRSALDKHGVVRDTDVRRAAVHGVLDAAGGRRAASARPPPRGGDRAVRQP